MVRGIIHCSRFFQNWRSPGLFTVGLERGFKEFGWEIGMQAGLVLRFYSNTADQRLLSIPNLHVSLIFHCVVICMHRVC